MKIVGIIQCRTGSKRLPNKCFLSLAGKSMIERYIERLKRCTWISDLVLATTNKEEDNVLEEVANRMGIECYRGSENDLAERFYFCAKQYKADVIVRLCADNPLVEPEEVDRLIKHSRDCDVDFASNCDNWNGSGYPDGLGAEVYSMKLLEQIFWEADGQEREHIHLFGRCCDNWGFPFCPRKIAFPQVKLDVNTAEDYEYVKKIYDKFGHNDFHVSEYIGGLI